MEGRCIWILSGSQHIHNAGFFNSLNCITLSSIKARPKGYAEQAGGGVCENVPVLGPGAEG